MNARAFTIGPNIFFARGRYSPGTTPGRRLIAHELAHVVQQSGNRPVLQRSPAGDEEEVNAEALHEADKSKVKTAFLDAGPFPFRGEGWTEQEELVNQVFEDLACFVSGIRLLTTPGALPPQTRYFRQKYDIWEHAAAAGMAAFASIRTMQFRIAHLWQSDPQQSNSWTNTFLWFGQVFVVRFPFLSRLYQEVVVRGTDIDFQTKSPYELRLVYDTEGSLLRMTLR